MPDRCPHCHQRIRKNSRVHIRAQLLPVLSQLSIQNEPMSTSEIKQLFENEPRTHAEIGSHFYQFAYFGLIRKDGDRWKHTVFCDKFFDGCVSIPEFVYVLDGEAIPTPADEPKAQQVYIRDIAPAHERVRECPQMLLPAFE